MKCLLFPAEKQTKEKTTEMRREFARTTTQRDESDDEVTNLGDTIDKAFSLINSERLSYPREETIDQKPRSNATIPCSSDPVDYLLVRAALLLWCHSSLQRCVKQVNALWNPSNRFPEEWPPLCHDLAAN